MFLHEAIFLPIHNLKGNYIMADYCTDCTQLVVRSAHESLYCTDCIQLVVRPAHESLYSEQATFITVVDEVGGCFIEVSQSTDAGENKIQLDLSEWPAIRAAIDAQMTLAVSITNDVEKGKSL